MAPFLEEKPFLPDLATVTPNHALSLPRDHISVSQIKMYLHCPAQYYFHYVKGIQVPPKGSMVLGKAVHKALEYYFGHKLFLGKPASTKDVLDVFSDYFDKERIGAVWDEEAGAAKDDGAGLIKLYISELAPSITPLAVEHKFEVQIAGTTLLGYIDLITTDGLIIDHKVSKRTPSENAASEDIQLSAYALGYRYLYGSLPQGVQFNYLVRNKVPKLVTRTAIRGEKDLARLIKIIEGVATCISNSVFYENPEPVKCNSLMCGYLEVCHSL